MKIYEIRSNAGLPDALVLAERPDPEPVGPQVVVALGAASLNYRDLIVAKGGYPRNDLCPVIPLSDGAGTVVAVGDEVRELRVGDRVVGSFLRDHVDGQLTESALRSSLGGGLNGVLAERFVLPEHALVKIPDALSLEQAATLPCAAVTAWNALTAAGTQAADTVLLLGTGGVSIFGLQFARALGARTIITSSSDEKLERARALGAEVCINYRTHPQWDDEVRRATGGRGVDHVLEVGGEGTLERSLGATRIGGTISMIGLLSQGSPSLLHALLNAQTVRGIYVGSARQLGEVVRAVAQNRIEPVIDQIFEFDEAHKAYNHLARQRHMGKVVIRGPRA